jgi:predicted RNase H-like nuclease (RuvC/YqgF family)
MCEKTPLPEEDTETYQGRHVPPQVYAKKKKVWENEVKTLKIAIRQLQQNNAVLLDKLQRWEGFYKDALAKVKENGRLRRENASLSQRANRLQSEIAQLKDEIIAVRKWAEGDTP